MTLSVSRFYIVDDSTINEYRAVGGCELEGEIKIIGEDLPQCQFFTTNPTWFYRGRRGGKPVINCLKGLQLKS
jgi:hypothetical protein